MFLMHIHSIERNIANQLAIGQSITLPILDLTHETQ